MLKIFSLFLLICSTSYGAIAFDTGGGNYCGSATSCAVTYTVGSLTNGIGIATVVDSNALPSGVNWGSNAMTLITTITTSSQYLAIYYYYLAPASGSTTITASDSSSGSLAVTAATYSGVAQTSSINTYNSATGTTNSSSVSVTTTVANAMLVDNASAVGKTSWTAQSGQTTAATGGTSFETFQAYRLVTTATSYTDSWSGSLTLAGAQITIALAPVAPLGAGFFNIISQLGSGVEWLSNGG